jgi:hypothetical protein
MLKKQSIVSIEKIVENISFLKNVLIVFLASVDQKMAHAINKILENVPKFGSVDIANVAHRKNVVAISSAWKSMLNNADLDFQNVGITDTYAMIITNVLMMFAIQK